MAHINKLNKAGLSSRFHCYEDACQPTAQICPNGWIHEWHNNQGQPNPVRRSMQITCSGSLHPATVPIYPAKKSTNSHNRGIEEANKSAISATVAAAATVRLQEAEWRRPRSSPKNFGNVVVVDARIPKVNAFRLFVRRLSVFRSPS